MSVEEGRFRVSRVRVSYRRRLYLEQYHSLGHMAAFQCLSAVIVLSDVVWVSKGTALRVCCMFCEGSCKDCPTCCIAMYLNWAVMHALIIRSNTCNQRYHIHPERIKKLRMANPGRDSLHREAQVAHDCELLQAAPKAEKADPGNPQG